MEKLSASLNIKRIGIPGDLVKGRSWFGKCGMRPPFLTNSQVMPCCCSQLTLRIISGWSASQSSSLQIPGFVLADPALIDLPSQKGILQKVLPEMKDWTKWPLQNLLKYWPIFQNLINTKPMINDKIVNKEGMPSFDLIYYSLFSDSLSEPEHRSWLKFGALSNDDWPGPYVIQSVIIMTDIFLIVSFAISFLMHKKLKK